MIGDMAHTENGCRLRLSASLEIWKQGSRCVAREGEVVSTDSLDVDFCQHASFCSASV